MKTKQRNSKDKWILIKNPFFFLFRIQRQSNTSIESYKHSSRLVECHGCGSSYSFTLLSVSGIRVDNGTSKLLHYFIEVRRPISGLVKKVVDWHKLKKRRGSEKKKKKKKLCYRIHPIYLGHLITKTCLYNFEPLKLHFYIVKLGFTGEYIIFLFLLRKFVLFLLKNIDCGYSLELPRRGGSNGYPQSVFWAEI